MKSAAERSAFEIAGEAFFLVRRAPLQALAWYYAGSVPFMVAFVFFWIDMSCGACCVDRCLMMSALLAALFVWMKFCQAVYGSRLRAALAGKDASRWPLGRIARQVALQSAFQPFGLLAIPVAILVMFPFHFVHAFFQNLTVADDDPSAVPSEVVRKAWRHAHVWPKQNHILIWLFSPWVFAATLIMVLFNAWLLKSFCDSIHLGELDVSFVAITGIVACAPLCPLAFAVAANAAAVLIAVSYLVGDLFGLGSMFAGAGLYMIMNTTFLIILYSLTYLCIDPLMKAACALRCFYDSAQSTGEDLLQELAEGAQ